MRTLIAQGTVVTARETFKADVLVDGERIAAVERSLNVSADRRIDAAGKLVLPGAIDVHTHLDLEVGDFSTADDFRSGTMAAACGGTTTVIDYATQARGWTLTRALETWKAKADGRAAVDYGFHLAVTDLSPAAEADLDRIAAEGVTSFKVYMAYPGRLMLDDRSIARLLAWTAASGSLVSVHAENGPAIAELVGRALAEGRTAPRYHAITRPVAFEHEAVSRVISLAEQAGAPVYIVHLSTADGLGEVRSARARGIRAFAETCPQYLVLSDELYDAPGAEAAKYIMSPPLRPPWHQNALWEGLASGDVQVIATDHCPFRLNVKLGHLDDFSRIPNGVPGIETRMSVIYDAGVRTQRMTANRFVDVTATSPAKIFGLHPRKGEVAIGSDADLIVFDPERTLRLSATTHHMRVDYSAYEGREVTGAPVAVLCRGRVVAENGEFTGRPGWGRFIERSASGEHVKTQDRRGHHGP
jgi:dihydropyrimidinase